MKREREKERKRGSKKRQDTTRIHFTYKRFPFIVASSDCDTILSGTVFNICK